MGTSRPHFPVGAKHARSAMSGCCPGRAWETLRFSNKSSLRCATGRKCASATHRARRAARKPRPGNQARARAAMTALACGAIGPSWARASATTAIASACGPRPSQAVVEGRPVMRPAVTAAAVPAAGATVVTPWTTATCLAMVDSRPAMRPVVTVAAVMVVAQRAMARAGVRDVICPTAKPLASRSSTARTL